MRMQALSSALPDYADGFLLTSESNVFYFTGFPCDAAVLLVTKSGNYFFTDSRYLEAAERVIQNAEILNSAKIADLLPKICEENGICKVLCESSAMTVRASQRYAALLSKVELLFEDDVQFLSQFRRKKTQDEADKIEKAQRIAEAAFEKLLPQIHVGMTEKEIALELDYTMFRLGADALSFRTIVVSGENSSLPHGVPGDRQVQDGDFITFDFGAVVDGYHSDMTRTIAIGHVTEKQREVYETVLQAQLSALSAIRSGITCKDADAKARDVIAAKGYGDAFGHGTGHGVGVEIHERPNLSPLSKETLEVGDVVTVEPGIYLREQFGVRIEDMVIVTQDGCRNFTKTEKSLLILPGSDS